MATMHIHLQDELKEQIAVRAAENGFASLEGYVESLLQADAGIDIITDEQLEKLLLSRVAGDSGLQLTAELIDDFKRQVAKRRSGAGGR